MESVESQKRLDMRIYTVGAHSLRIPQDDAPTDRLTRRRWAQRAHLGKKRGSPLLVDELGTPTRLDELLGTPCLCWPLTRGVPLPTDELGKCRGELSRPSTQPNAWKSGVVSDLTRRARATEGKDKGFTHSHQRPYFVGASSCRTAGHSRSGEGSPRRQRTRGSEEAKRARRRRRVQRFRRRPCPSRWTREERRPSR